MHNSSTEIDKREKLRHIMRGQYDFKFGASSTNMRAKLQKVSGEPVAYHLYKRRDLAQKIDKLAVEKLHLARIVYDVT